MKASYSKQDMKNRLKNQDSEFYRMLGEMRDQRSVKVPSQNQTIMDLVKGEDVKKYNIRSMIRPSTRKRQYNPSRKGGRKRPKDSEQVLDLLDVISYKNRLTPQNNPSSVVYENGAHRDVNKSMPKHHIRAR